MTDMSESHTVPCGRSCHRTKACWAAYMREYRLRNLDTFKARERARYHREKGPEMRARRRDWYARTKETQAQKRREMRERRGDEMREYRRNYWATRERALHSKAKGITREWAAVLRADPCSYCGASAGELDHIAPVTRGGLHEYENLTAACKSCNSSKYNDPLLVFLTRAA